MLRQSDCLWEGGAGLSWLSGSSLLFSSSRDHKRTFCLRLSASEKKSISFCRLKLRLLWDLFVFNLHLLWVAGD